MASVKKKGIYEDDDRVDEFLVNKVAKKIRYEKLTSFAKNLKIKERELEIIMAPNYLYPEDRASKVGNFNMNQILISYWIFWRKKTNW